MEKKGKILIADDNGPIREILSEIIGESFPEYSLGIFEEGHSLRSDLAKGLEGTALIIADNDVPEKNLGLKITKEYSGRGVPFIMMSGYNIEKEAIQNGAYGFLLKPFGLFEFKKMVGESLEK